MYKDRLRRDEDGETDIMEQVQVALDPCTYLPCQTTLPASTRIKHVSDYIKIMENHLTQFANLSQWIEEAAVKTRDNLCQTQIYCDELHAQMTAEANQHSTQQGMDTSDPTIDVDLEMKLANILKPEEVRVILKAIVALKEGKVHVLGEPGTQKIFVQIKCRLLNRPLAQSHP